MSASAAFRRIAAAALLLVGALPRPAAAEEVYGTRSERLVEQSHDIRLELDHGVATLRVRRTVHNGGLRHDQAVFWIDLPEGAVATGLRTKGMLDGRPHWFEGNLLEAETAAARYRELTGIGGYYPKDPALLSWRDQSLLALQVFPVAPETDKTVEYTLKVPTDYDEGRDHLVLPAMGTERHPARLILQTAHRRDQLFVDGEPVARGAPITLDREHTLSLARYQAPAVEAHLASVPFADERALMHVNVALAREISSIPKKARVVVVLDGSRSLTDEHRHATLATARAYLDHFTDSRLDARAEVLTFDHEVKERHGRLVPAREARADLDHLDLPGRNGSHVDEALERANELLKGGRGPRRILLLTDARTRDALAPARLRTLTKASGAIVHVGIVEVGAPQLSRDDAHPWTEVATTTGGLVWQLAADPEPDASADRARVVFEELARPVRIDHLQVSVPPIVDDEIHAPEMLVEGEGLEALAIVSGPIDHLRVEGELWSQPLRETVFPEDEHNRRWAALVFGSDVLFELEEEEMMPLAILGGAVSPVTSYLAIEPGVRPSTEGLDETEGLGLIGRGSGGGTGMGTIGLGTVGLLAPDTRLEFLQRAVRDSLDACGGRDLAVRVDLETTLEELVAISGLHIPGSTDPLLATCLETQLWDIDVRPDFVDEWRKWTIDLPST